MTWNVPNIFSPGTKILSALVDQNFQYIADILNNSIISLDSPAFTGSPTAPTKNQDDNSSNIATTNFVLNQISVEEPLQISDDVAHTGSSYRGSREDHEHPNYIKTQPVDTFNNTIASTGFVINQIEHQVGLLAYLPVYSSNNPAIDDAIKINAAINSVNSGGYGIVYLMPGHFYTKTPIIIKSGITLKSNRSATSIEVQADMEAVITQTDITQYIINSTIEGISINANRVNYTVTNTVYLSPIGIKINDCDIQHGTGDAIRFVRNAVADWTNYIFGTTVGDHPNGAGIWADMSDSQIINCYMSGNKYNIYGRQAGGMKVTDNQMEGATTSCVVIDSETGEDSWVFTNNYFDQNYCSVQFINSYGAPIQMLSSFTGNTFHRALGPSHIVVDDYIQYACFSGNTFDEKEHDGPGTNLNDFSFGVGCDGWQLANTHAKLLGDRFVNLPSDAQVASAGNSSSLLTGTRIIVGNGSFSLADPNCSFYSNTTFNSYVNVVARFGVYKDTANLDAAVYVQIINGNEPTLNFGAGETTTPTHANLQLNGSNLAKLTSDAGFCIQPYSSAPPPDDGLLSFETPTDNKLYINFKGYDGTIRKTGMPIGVELYPNVYALPELYGAASDGITDDTIAIQNCINANPGKTIYITNSLISDTIRISTPNTKITGNNLLMNVSGKDAIYFAPTNVGISNVFLNDVGISNIEVVFTGTQTATGAGVKFSQCNRWTSNDIRIIDFPEGFVVLGGALGNIDGLFLIANSHPSGGVVNNSSLLSFDEAPYGAGLYQPCYTNTVSQLKIQTGKHRYSLIKIGACDSLSFDNAYISYGSVCNILLLHSHDNGSLNPTFSSFYNDCVDMTTGTPIGLYAPNDSFTNTYISTQLGSTCFTGNATAQGILLQHPRVVFADIQGTIVNTESWGVQIVGSTGFGVYNIECGMRSVGQDGISGGISVNTGKSFRISSRFDLQLVVCAAISGTWVAGIIVGSCNTSSGITDYTNTATFTIPIVISANVSISTLGSWLNEQGSNRTVNVLGNPILEYAGVSTANSWLKIINSNNTAVNIGTNNGQPIQFSAPVALIAKTVAQLNAILSPRYGDRYLCTDCCVLHYSSGVIVQQTTGTGSGSGGPVWWDGASWRVDGTAFVATA